MANNCKEVSEGLPEKVDSQTEPLIEQETPVVPKFYFLRLKPVEGFKLPSSDQLVAAARSDLKKGWGKDFDVPNPPDELFETLENFAARGIREFDETYYFPQIQLTEGDEFWRGIDRVKPAPSFWQKIEEGEFPEYVAKLEEGWYIFDRRVKPMYAGGQQRYGKDDYMEPLMDNLRAFQSIGRYIWGQIPRTSRAGVNPGEIEEILRTFAHVSGAKGIVRNRRYIEFNVLGNIAHPELGQTDTFEWFENYRFGDDYRLSGGSSDRGGLADVSGGRFDSRKGDAAAFSPRIRFPSKGLYL